jgi:hypothetical protein
MGRPTKYETRFAKMAGKATALGATLDDLAELFDVEHSTIALWQTKHHAFSDAIKTARVDADATVERSLYQRALGYRAKTQKVVVANGSAEVVDYEEQHAPEVAAGIFWLKNRKPQEWRDKIDVEHSGNIDFAGALESARKRKAAAK